MHGISSKTSRRRYLVPASLNEAVASRDTRRLVLQDLERGDGQLLKLNGCRLYRSQVGPVAGLHAIATPSPNRSMPLPQVSCDSSAALTHDVLSSLRL